MHSAAAHLYEEDDVQAGRPDLHVSGLLQGVRWNAIEFAHLAAEGVERETGFEPATSTLASSSSAYGGRKRDPELGSSSIGGLTLLSTST